MISNKQLTILLVAPQPFFQDRGTPIAVRLLSEALAEEGHNVHLLVYHEGKDIEMEGVTLHRIPNVPLVKGIRPGMSFKKLICDLFIFYKMIRLSRALSFDLIHAVEEAVFLAQFLKLFTKTPYIYDMDSSMSGQIIDKQPVLKKLEGPLESFEKSAIRGSAGVIAVCRALEDTARRLSPNTPIVRLEDISLLDANKQGEEILRDHYNISGLLLLYVGNLESYQGIDLLLESFSKAYGSGINGHLVIIGGTTDNIEKYKFLSEQLTITSRVHFIGPRPIDTLGYYLAQADILVSPRTQGNNTPMKIYSYLASGKAVLATRLSTHTQVLNDKVACLVAPDSEAMAKGIEQLCEDSSLRECLGNAGKKLASSEYSLPAFKQKLSSFYYTISIGSDI